MESSMKRISQGLIAKQIVVNDFIQKYHQIFIKVLNEAIKLDKVNIFIFLFLFLI
jgi:hypothetical protein